MFKDKQNKSDAFDEFMFGRRKPMDKQEQEGNSFLEKIDLDELLDTVDLVMSSAKQLKPIVRKLSPFVQQFINKD